MAIAQDNISAGVATTNSTISWNHTISAGLSGSGLIVGATTAAAPAQTITSVVWDQTGANQALSNTVNAAAASLNSAGGNSWCYLWWKASPTAGTSKQILVTASGSCELNAGAISVSGWNGTFNAASPQSSALGGNTNPTVTVTTTANEWAVDCFVTENNNQVALTETGTKIFSTTVGLTNSDGGSQYKVAAGASTTMNWTGVTSTNSATIVGVSLIPTPGPTITQQPTNQATWEGLTATFSLTASGSGGLTYQWKQNGSNVGTSSSSYTTPTLTPANNGDLYTCDVTDSNGTTTSNGALLTVWMTGKPWLVKA